MTPSETSRRSRRAVGRSTGSLRASQSPYEHTRSAPRARANALATGESSSRSPTKYARRRASVSGRPIAAPAGETCLNEAAAATPVTFRSSRTSCQALSASSKLMYPGAPLRTSNGKSAPENTRAGAWCGFTPYRSVRDSVPIVALAREDHRHPVAVRRADQLGIATRAAGLNHGRHPRVGGPLERVGEGEEAVR